MASLVKFAIQLSYNISEREKDFARKALIGLKYVKNNLDKCINYLKLIQTPFKDNNDLTPEDTWKTRAALWQYRDNTIDKFNTFKLIAFKSFLILNIFSSDTQVENLKKTYVVSIQELENLVNKFSDLFNDIESKDFKENMVKSIDLIVKKSDEIKKIIDERIETHLKQNILAKTWVDEMSSELGIDIEENEPLIKELIENRKNN